MLPDVIVSGHWWQEGDWWEGEGDDKQELVVCLGQTKEESGRNTYIFQSKEIN